MKQELAMVQGRCEICTLIPPCKHMKEAIGEMILEEPKLEDSLYDPGSLKHDSF